LLLISILIIEFSRVSPSAAREKRKYENLNKFFEKRKIMRAVRHGLESKDSLDRTDRDW
jgi:hypothetical protein